MTRSLVAFAMLGLVAAPGPALAQTDITGAWIITINSPLGQVNVDTRFTQTGEKITGSVDGPAGEPLQFSGTMVEKQLSALYPLPLQGQTLQVKLTDTAESDRMSGQVDVGGLAQATWTAKRKPAVAPFAEPIAPRAGDPTGVTGTWNMAIRLGAFSLPLTSALAQTGDAVTGTIRTPVGEVPATGTMANGHLVLQFTAQMPQGAVPITLKGDLSPQELAGTSSAVGLGRSEWSATRAE